MKKIFLILLVATFMFSSCKQESLGVAKVTTYATMTLNGNANLFWPLNTPFVDPGCKAVEGTTDISSKIAVSSNVDATKGGKYTMTYKVANSDGFFASVSRTVYVYDTTSALNGYYSSSITRTVTTTGVVASRGPFKILVFGVGSGNIWVEDLLGGWYYYGSAYGIAYAGIATLKVNADNSLTVVKSSNLAFSSASACVLYAASTWDPAAKKFVIHSTMGDTPQYHFDVTMSNPQSLN
ncbi:MAG: DUF5012 domain-containing protein [Paludibacter sp.]|nr:DUF5012 domain-containing protein [Paludibacter sp.]